MSEDLLTQVLLDMLRRGDVRKLTRTTGAKTIEFRREVGNNSFRADIFISLADDIRLSKDISKDVNFIAIEVKIKDWKQGLYQAWRYHSFAEKSFLALYEPYAKNVDLTLFREYNVGLIVFSEKKIEIRNRPRQGTFKKSDSYSASLREQIWNTLPSVKSVQPAI